MENARAAFLDAVRKSMRAIRTALGAATINPALLTCAEKLQYEGYLWREETNAAILNLARAGVPIKQIARQLGCSRKLVRQAVRGETGDVFRTRESTLDAYVPFLDAQWEAPKGSLRQNDRAVDDDSARPVEQGRVRNRSFIMPVPKEAIRLPVPR
jgi:Homeodomain-like domain